MSKITVLLMSIVLAGCSAPQASGLSAEPSEPVVVAVAQAAMTDVATAIDSGGVVQARTTATIAARILAPVREVRVSPGDRVRKGHTLVVLDGNDLAAGARAADDRARIAEAVAPFHRSIAARRWRAMRAEGSVTPDRRP